MHNELAKCKHNMNWYTLASTLLGALFIFSGILFTHALDFQRKRAYKRLVHALTQALQDEIAGLLKFAKTSSVHQMEARPDVV